MAKDSRYIQLTDYCLVEYLFSERIENNPEVIIQDIHQVRNSGQDQNQCYYEDNNNPAIRNTQDVSTIFIGDNKFVRNDTDTVPNYTEYDDDLEKTVYEDTNFQFDAIRFHFIAGFDFTEFEGMIMTIAHQQNNGLLNYVASVIANPHTIDSLIYFNHRPIFLTDALYDRYIEIRVPSIYHINKEYYSLPQAGRGGTLAAKLTPDGEGGYVGFIDNAPIRVGLHECNQGTDIVNSNNEEITYEVWTSQNRAEASVPQVSRFGNLGMVLKEADDGDYIEYYATENGQFVEDFIGRLTNASPTDDWAVIHQLTVSEQVGSSFTITKKLIDVQEDGFDEPQTFRPVLKFADEAVSFSIDYLYRLINRRNGEQVIKRGSLSSTDVKKYGKKARPIALDGKPKSNKIYNRIYNSTKDATRLFTEPTVEDLNLQATGVRSVVERKVYTPVFFDMNRVSASSRNYSVNTSDKETDIVYRNGGMPILLTPFDNVYKFKFYEIVNGEPAPMDLAGINASNFMIHFEIMGYDRLSFDYVKDSLGSKLSRGEIVFKVPEKEAKEILRMNFRKFFVTVETETDGTIMYQGQWKNSDEIDEIREIEDTAREQLEAQQAVALAEIETDDTAGTARAPGTIPKGTDRTTETSAAMRINPPPDNES